MKLPENVREFFRRQGKIGATKRQQVLSPERRRAIAKKAAKTRWAKAAAKQKSTAKTKRTGGTK